MGVKITKKLIPTSRYNWKSHTTMKPVGICVHNTANDASALNEISYMTRVDKKVSYHYAVDDIQAVQALPENRTGWHAGDNLGPGNMKHIGIEICYSKSGGDRFIKSEQNAVLLIVDILKRYGWGIDKVKKHQDFSGKYCLPIFETDLLTRNGWIKLSDVNIGDEVAQYNNGVIEFTKVLDVVEPYESETIKNRVLEATPDHRILYKLQKSPVFDKWTDWNTAQSDSSGIYIPVGGIYKTDGIELSDDEIKLLVWIQGDGHYMTRNNLGRYGIEFHLSKQRKIDRLLSLLADIGIQFTFITQHDGTSKIRLFGKQHIEFAETYLDNKMFSWKLLEMSQEQREVFLEELLKVDGCKSANSYCSTKQQNYDVVQAICSVSNKRAYQTTTGNSTALIFNNSRLTVNSRSNYSIQTKLVGCVSVRSGAILVRQNGRNLVVGNCPHRTLDMGWQRFLNMVSKELAGNSWKEEAVLLKEGERIYESTKETALVKIDSGAVVKTYPKGTELEFSAKYKNWYITPYSFDRNIKNGFLVSEMKLKAEPLPEEPQVPSEEEVLRKQVADLKEENGVLRKDLAASISLNNDKNSEILQWKEDYDDLQKKYDVVYVDKNKYENLYAEAVRELNDPKRVKSIKTARLVAELLNRMLEFFKKNKNKSKGA